MGALADMCHVRAWEIDLLTLHEFEAYCAYIDKTIEAQSQG